MESSTNKRRFDAICCTAVRRPTKRLHLYGPGSLLPEDLLYVYGEVIMQRNRYDELVYRPNQNYVKDVHNNSLDALEDRATLANFMIYASSRLGFYTDTLHLAVRNMDRYFSVEKFTSCRQEVLGLALLFDSAKHLESNQHIPFSTEIADKLRDTFDVQDTDITNIETQILITLNFDMVVPTTILFIRSVIERAEPITGVQFAKLQCLTEYLGELTLLEYKFLRYSPSLIAASIIYYALLILNPNEVLIWTPNLRDLTGYSLHFLRECVNDIYDLHCNKAFLKKYDCAAKVYARSDMMEVAELKPVALPFGFQIPAEKRGNRRHTL